MLAKILFAFLFATASASLMPRAVTQDDTLYYITSSDGGVLTAHPDEPPTFPGHTYPIPGKVFVEAPQNKPEQKWSILGSAESNRLQSEANWYNEVDTYMIDDMSFPMQNVWGFTDAGNGRVYIVNRILQGRCLNNDRLGSRVHQGICDSAGSGSKWTLTPVNSLK